MESSSYWSVQFVQLFLCHQLANSYDLSENLVCSLFSIFLCFSLVTNNRHPSYNSGILCQDYGILRGFIGHHRSANLVCLRYPPSRPQNHTSYHLSYEVCRLGHHLPEQTKTGGPNYRIGPDCAGHVLVQQLVIIDI